MLKAIVGSIVGGLVAGAVAIVATAPARTSTPASPWATVSEEAVGRVDPFGTRAATDQPALVECEPHQRADLRRIVVNGRPVAQVSCVSVVQPVTYQGSDIVTTNAAPRTLAASPTVVRERVVTREPVRRASTKRSWAKTALVIGGGTGAGAGVGGLVGGKKGALIGAALGGGSAAIFEAVKR